MKKGILASLVCLASLVASVHGATGVPKIAFDRTTYDFGKTSLVTSVTGTFVLSNAGTGELRIDPPVSSCSCTVVGLKPSVLQPGEKSELTFTLHLPTSGGTVQKLITVISNDPQSRTNHLTVKADYVPLYEIVPANWYLVTLRKGEVTNLTARVTRTDGKKFHISRIQTTQANSTNWLETTVTPEPNPSSSNMTAVITAKLTASDGPRYISEVLSVYDGEEKPAFTIPVSARVMGDVSLNREMVYWAVIDPTKVVANQILTATTSLPGKLEITKITSSLPSVTVQATPKDDHTVEIQAQLAKIPERTTNGVIHLETNMPTQPKIDVPVVIAVFEPTPPVTTPAR